MARVCGQEPAAVQTHEPPSRGVPPVAASGSPIANCAGCGSHFRQEAAEQTMCSQCRYWQIVYRTVFPKGNT
jgi:hypothetical protein